MHAPHLSSSARAPNITVPSKENPETGAKRSQGSSSDSKISQLIGSTETVGANLVLKNIFPTTFFMPRLLKSRSKSIKKQLLDGKGPKSCLLLFNQGFATALARVLPEAQRHQWTRGEVIQDVNV